MARKYINELGFNDILIDLKPTDKRWESWQKEIEEYGFANYETWCMDYFFYAWLYERLKFYKEFACVDLNEHRFEFKGDKYTQGELIDKMIQGCEIALRDEGRYMVQGEDAELMEDVAHIWAIVIPSMWW